MDTAQLTRWTALAAFVLYAMALALRLIHRSKASRVVWSAGCALFLLHVFFAFQFVHHWSHAAAYAETARRTAEITGLSWGGGIYANYAFTILWMIDASGSWLRPRAYEGRSRLVDWAMQAFFAFMWINATVVFGSGAARGLGVCVYLLLLGLWSWSRRASAKR